MMIDKKGILQFAPLNGEEANKYKINVNYKEIDSIIYLSNGSTFIKSKAILKLLEDLYSSSLIGWKIKFLGKFAIVVLKLTPNIISDLVYDYIAKKRLSWFGVNNKCRLPNDSEKSKILL